MTTPPNPQSHTVYFLGVSTAGSFIHRVFPRWMKLLGYEYELRGIDLPVGVGAEAYQSVIERIKGDPLAAGAIVTSHKVGIYQAAAGLFDHLEPAARTFGEITVIYKRDGLLLADVTDILTVGLALDAFLPRDHWSAGQAKACILGCGGAAVALAYHLLSQRKQPRRIVITDTRAARMDDVRQRLRPFDPASRLHFVHAEDDAVNDRVVADLPSGSLVVNATGLGKDRPGSPISADAVLPREGFIWDFNYRGPLDFLATARRQATIHTLHVEDGWSYFLHGWTTALARIISRPIDEQTCRQMEQEAEKLRRL